MLNENSINASEDKGNLTILDGFYTPEKPLTPAGYLATGVYLCFVGKFHLYYNFIRWQVLVKQLVLDIMTKFVLMGYHSKVLFLWICLMLTKLFL